MPPLYSYITYFWIYIYGQWAILFTLWNIVPRGIQIKSNLSQTNLTKIRWGYPLRLHVKIPYTFLKILEESKNVGKFIFRRNVKMSLTNNLLSIKRHNYYAESMSFSEFLVSEFFSDNLVCFHHGNFPINLPIYNETSFYWA